MRVVYVRLVYIRLVLYAVDLPCTGPCSIRRERVWMGGEGRGGRRHGVGRDDVSRDSVRCSIVRIGRIGRLGDFGTVYPLNLTPRRPYPFLPPLFLSITPLHTPSCPYPLSIPCPAPALARLPLPPLAYPCPPPLPVSPPLPRRNTVCKVHDQSTWMSRQPAQPPRAGKDRQAGRRG